MLEVLGLVFLILLIVAAIVACWPLLTTLAMIALSILMVPVVAPYNIYKGIKKKKRQQAAEIEKERQ